MKAVCRTGMPFIALAALLAACDNPVGERHESPHGVVVREGPVELVRLTGEHVSGQLTLEEGEQKQITVRFLNREGGDLPPEPGYWLRVTVSPAIATWQPASAGGFDGTLAGGEAGSGTITFELMHGAVGAGHADYTSGSHIDIVVASPNTVTGPAR